MNLLIHFNITFHLSCSPHYLLVPPLFWKSGRNIEVFSFFFIPFLHLLLAQGLSWVNRLIQETGGWFAFAPQEFKCVLNFLMWFKEFVNPRYVVYTKRLRKHLAAGGRGCSVLSLAEIGRDNWDGMLHPWKGSMSDWSRLWAAWFSGRLHCPWWGSWS